VTMSSDNSNGKLIATAVGAAAAGAILAVAAMKMTEGSGNNMSRGSGSSSSNNIYSGDHPVREGRPSLKSYIVNEPNPLDQSYNMENTVQTEVGETLLFPHNHEEKMRRRIATRVAVEEENNMPRDSVTVRVPATSANVGPGCTLCLRFLLSKGCLAVVG
jgi:hypothetical protein